MEQALYGPKYNDGIHEFRNVVIPDSWIKNLPQPPRLMSELEIYNLGIRHTSGWIHYMLYPPEPYLLMFRRSLIKS